MFGGREKAKRRLFVGNGLCHRRRPSKAFKVSRLPFRSSHTSHKLEVAFEKKVGSERWRFIGRIVVLQKASYGNLYNHSEKLYIYLRILF